MNIGRFVKAQNIEPFEYQTALQEVKSGHKLTHWIWYIFPQMRGLGYSMMSDFYGIADKDEAIKYINNKTLRDRLIEITKAVYNNVNTPDVIFGYDLIKFISCMKLFASVSDNSIFSDVLNKYGYE